MEGCLALTPLCVFMEIQTHNYNMPCLNGDGLVHGREYVRHVLAARKTNWLQAKFCGRHLRPRGLLPRLRPVESVLCDGPVTPRKNSRRFFLGWFTWRAIQYDASQKSMLVRFLKDYSEFLVKDTLHNFHSNLPPSRSPQPPAPFDT